MIIVNLAGGMGNQMFQYSFAKAISNNYDIPFCLDRYYLDNIDSRFYDLDLFNIKVDFFQRNTNGGDLPSRSQNGQSLHHARHADGKISISVPDGVQVIYENFVQDVSYNERLFTPFNCGFDRGQDIYYVGYFQDPTYTDCIYDELVEDFTFRNPIADLNSLNLLDQILNSNSVMLNVRRTDYVGNPIYGTLGLDYYRAAIRIIDSRVLNPRYFIFSDDVDWCTENFKNLKNSYIVDHSYKGDRFGQYSELMRNCRHFIIANSSFAWWSAYLSSTKDKIVIAPKPWFKANIKTNIVSAEMNWIQLPSYLE